MTKTWSLLQVGQKENYKVAYINARIIDPETKLDIKGSLLTEGSKIIDFGESLFSNRVPSGIDETVDCKGLVLMPGLIDIHVHFREPGQEYKETIYTGSKSAAAGGVTTVVCQPNTVPAIDSIVLAKYLKYRALETSHVNVEFYAKITISEERLTEMALLKEAGAIGFTDDGMPVMNPMVMRQGMLYSSMLNVPIAQHAEDLNLSAGGAINAGKVSEELGIRGILSTSESVMVSRDILLMKDIENVHYHILHISSKDSLDAVRHAKNLGLNVTCEVTPHHFALTEDVVKQHGAVAKVNPPLRTEGDRLAMVEGLKTGVIDCIATDHAPHDRGSKDLSLEDATFGIVGLETVLPLSLELYHSGQMSLFDVLAKLTYKPADIIHLPRGRIQKNLAADLILVDLNHKWEVKIDDFASKSKNSPFNGRKVKGHVVRTIVSGKTVYLYK
ncbi:dihydroorotase [Wolbachia endosymbiont of Dirofilaria (Dirofilaria) immitis]|uniref:dihydroorotase n=1 Tax=Wolbachia endosymbiont of Dirofilaria (Dirofilaria) immitis TaxID=1812115 RepID=UPI00158969F5|nr:dihydroorotase [Wolbachia endosymbiont of Dirofilaria (Dirofilaria) immitis]QKX02032.1 amidohydrolase family protein [Wolbachia endosymbiont of Dirofilaria (Dirofilaria) immitis]